MNKNYSIEKDEQMNLVWPFYKYTVLIPEQIKGDLFVWLYLSLIVFKNQENKLAKDSYSDDVINSVKNILIAKFSSVISSGEDSNLQKIIQNAEEQYITEDENGKRLKNITFSFIETYSELFSNNLQTKYIYQDAITGDVLPYFGPELSLDESEDSKEKLDLNSKVKRPSKSAIKNAYKNYNSLQKNNMLEEDDDPETETSEVESFDTYNSLFYNPDDNEAAFFETLDNEFEETTKALDNKIKKIDTSNFNVVYLENTKVNVNYDVKVRIVDNILTAESPFGNRTNVWMSKCLNKAKNIHPVLEEKIREFEEQANIRKPKSNETKIKFAPRQDLADSLYACGPLYRLVSSLDNPDLLKIILKIDTHLKNENSEEFFPQIGKYLECLIEPFELSDKDTRLQYTYSFYCNEVTQSCGSINYTRLLKESIFKDWQKGWQAFKAEFADLLIFKNLSSASNIYYDFVEDVYMLYDMRNQYSHYNSETKEPASQKQIDLLLKITKVIAEIY